MMCLRQGNRGSAKEQPRVGERKRHCPRRGGSIMPRIRLTDVYGPDTLKMIYEVFDDLLRLTVIERTSVDPWEDLAYAAAACRDTPHAPLGRREQPYRAATQGSRKIFTTARHVLDERRAACRL